MKYLFIKFIEVYQRTISPDHGMFRARYPYGFCKFYPSCSEYAKLSISKDGVFLGIYRAFVRVLKCNPWSSPGVDLPGKEN